MSKIDEYRQALLAENDWDSFLMVRSGLPGPRGNIELAMAAAGVASMDQIRRWLQWTADRAPTNTSEEFLTFCGVLALGRLLADDPKTMTELRQWAADPRWRVREAVAMALQRFGDEDFGALLDEMRDWANGTCLEQRAAAAALCEPRLVHDQPRVAQVLELLDVITESMTHRTDRREEGFRALRKGMGYCWSVAVAADFGLGRPFMERWIRHPDPDVRWIMRENLRKKRLERIDRSWVERQLSLAAGS